MLRLYLTIFCLVLIQGCAVTERFFPGDEAEGCAGDDCEAPALLDNSNSDRKWYCYGTSPDEPWQCQNTADTSKITTVNPDSRGTRRPARISAPETPPPVVASLPQRPRTVRVPDEPLEAAPEAAREATREAAREPDPEPVLEPTVTPSDTAPIATERVSTETVAETTPLPQVPVTEPAPAPLRQAKPEPTTPKILPGEQSPFAEEVLDSPSGHYAVQLIALRDLSGIIEYANLNGITDPLYVKIRNDQTDWYILLLGIYPERTLAESARRDWQTAKVLRVQPWIRQLGGLQEAILKANG